MVVVVVEMVEVAEVVVVWIHEGRNNHRKTRLKSAGLAAVPHSLQALLVERLENQHF